MPLPQETAQAIEAFSKRRRELILMRGMCAAAVSLLGVMSALALLDRFVLMPDRLRWMLSLAGYGGIGFVLWRVCLRHLFGKESVRQTARLIEKARPDLREDLLSAVELDEADGASKNFDSPVFRSLLQRDVAGRVSETKADELLPAKLISPWVKGAGIAVLLFVALLFSPHFPQLFSRALLPGANLARPSDIKILFIAPDPADRIVAAGDTQALEVKIEGGDIDRVTLETNENGKTEKVYLTREAGNRFVGGIKVGAADVRYRVRAHHSLTRFHTLASRPRPAVSEFVKSYMPPSYSGLKSHTHTHQHGDLSGLEGTVVDLTLSVNQEMAEAELQLQADRKDIEPLTIPLEKNGVGKLVASVALDGRHSAFKVHLVAAESGFENTFSPLFEIRAVPDLTPKVELAEPENNRDVRSNESLAMRGSAEDDVALAEILHAYRINTGSWTEVSLVGSPGKLWEFEMEWQLRLLPLQPGDIVVTKLVAIDTKGNRGESAPVRLAVAAEEDNSEERAWAEREKVLAEELANLREEAERAAHEAHEAAKVLKKDPEQRDLQDRQQLVKAEKAATEAEETAAKVWQQLEQALSEAPDRAEAEQLEAVAAKVADAKNQGLQRLQDTMQDAASGIEAPPEEGHHRPEHLAWDAADAARRAAEAMRALAAEDMAEIVAEDLEHLADNQAEIAEDARGVAEDALDAVAERQDIARHRAEAMEGDLRDLSQQLDEGQSQAARKTAEQIERERKQLDDALAADNAAERLPDASQRMEQRLENAARQAAQLAENAERRADQAMRELEDATPSPSHEVEELRWEAEQLAQQQDRLDREGNASRAAEMAEQLAEARDNFEERAEAAADHLADLSRAEMASAASNPQEAHDLADAARALDDIAEAATEAENADHAREVAGALGELRDAMEATEAAARAEDIASGLEDLANLEQTATNSEPPPSAASAPSPEEGAELTEQIADDLRRLPEDISRALERPQEQQRAAQQAANSDEARALGREMQERQQASRRGDEPRQPNPQSENIASLEEDIAELQQALEPAAAEAREQLASMAPEAPEMLRELANDLQDSAAASEALAAQSEQTAGEENAETNGDPSSPSASELTDAASELGAAAEDASESLEDVAKALADDASAQDLSSAEGREAARDADDAIAQLRANAEPQAEAAREALAEAAAAPTPGDAAEAFEQAAQAQRELAQDLEDLADQLETVAKGDAGQADGARTALRDSEGETGVEEALGEAYEQAEDLSELMATAAENPQAALAALESELANNPAMQAALGELAAEKAMRAAESLADAAAKEAAMSEGPLPQAGSPQSPAAQQQQAINSAAAQAASDLASAAVHAQRLGENSAAAALESSGESAGSFASEQGEGSGALDQLSSSSSPGSNQSAVEDAKESLAQSAQSASEAAQHAAQAAANQAAQSPAASAEAHASAAALAAALDSLSEQMAANAAGQASASPGSATAQSGQPQSAPQSDSPSATAAQQALAEAQAQQAAAMAQSRARGQTPGTSSPSASMAQGQPGAASQSPGQNPPGQPGSAQVVGNGVAAGGKAYVLTTVQAGARATDAGEGWSKLPSKVAKDIMEARRQDVAPEYRSAIESYYKAIADRARGQQK